MSNFLCQFWNDKSIPLQVLYPFSVSWKIICLYFFSSDNIYFAEKEPIKMKIFETFRVLGSKFVKFLMPIWKRQVDSSPNFVSLFSFMKDYSSVRFLAQTIYTLLKRNPLKWTFLRLFEYSGRNLSNFLCQFGNDKTIPLQILYPSSVSWKIPPLYFFSSNNIYFAPKEPIKVKMFETFKCSGQN